jgi:hypothetical protein
MVLPYNISPSYKILHVIHKTKLSNCVGARDSAVRLTVIDKRYSNGGGQSHSGRAHPGGDALTPVEKCVGAAVGIIVTLTPGIRSARRRCPGTYVEEGKGMRPNPGAVNGRRRNDDELTKRKQWHGGAHLGAV